jgi:hypothetical protein
VWFAGVHSDVGGSYPEPESQLSKIALRWMLCEAELAGLLINPSRKADILGGKAPYVAPDPTTKNQHESLQGRWWIAEIWPKIGQQQDAQGTWHSAVRFNLGRKRWISPGSLFHQSVQQRLAANNIQYRPDNLPTQLVFVTDRCDLIPTVSPAVDAGGV